MTILRIHFAGQIKKAEHKQAGGKAICEVSVVRTHKGRNGAENSYTWLRVTIWEPADFQTPKLVKGAFIAGSGELQMRSYVGKDGAKGHSLECRSSSHDVEVGDGGEGEPQALPVKQTPAPMRPVEMADHSDPPF